MNSDVDFVLCISGEKEIDDRTWPDTLSSLGSFTMTRKFPEQRVEP